MLKLGQRGSVYLSLLIILVLSLFTLICLASSGINWLPKVFAASTVSPKTTFQLSPNANSVKVGDTITIKLNVRSDIDAVNLLKANISFSKELLSVVSINYTNTIVKNWVEQYSDNATGTISLIGGIPNPGFKTSVDNGYSPFAVINFKALKAGSANIAIADQSAMYSNLNNSNILSSKETLNINITPIPSPTPASIFGKAISLDGKNYVTFPTTQKDSTACSIGTLQMWVKMDKSNLKRTANIISKIGTYRGFDLSTNGSGTLAFYMYGQQFFSNTSLTPDKWYHIAIVNDFYPPTAANKRGTYIYLNGKVDGFKKIPGSLNNHCQNSNGALRIGNSSLGFIGQIDEVNIDSGILYRGEFTPPTKPHTGGSIILHFDNTFNDSGYYKFSGQAIYSVPFVDSTISKK